MSNNPNKKNLEHALEQYYAFPSPRKEFSFKLAQSLQQSLPMETNQVARNGKWFRSRLSYISMAALIILLITLLIIGPTKVMAALQRLFGYIPGYGLIDETTSIRVLAQPVSVTRDGITLTIKQAILSPERTSLTYTVQGLPTAAQPQWIVTEKDRICASITEIGLADGKRLSQTGGGAAGYDENNFYQYVLHFEPVPSGVSEAVWLVPCIPETLTGKAPSNWNLPMRFISAPPDLSPLPVIEVISEENGETISRNPIVEENLLTLDKVIETADGYIFIGRMLQNLPGVTVFQPVEMFDRNGNPLGYSIPGDLDLRSDVNMQEWAFQIRGKEWAWPLTIQIPSAIAECSSSITFGFDVGFHPIPGQSWDVDQEFEFGQCTARLEEIKRTIDGYQFHFAGYDGSRQWVWADIKGNDQYQRVSRVNLFGQYEELKFEGEPPDGKLIIVISGNTTMTGPWQVQWQPEE